jgi:hypothetical protein
MTIMRPIRSLATVLLLASLALTGCWTSQAEEPAAPATRPPAAMAAPTTRTSASTSLTTALSTTTAPGSRDPACVGARSWGTGPKQVLATPISAEIYQVRAATHQTCDRVVFDLNGLGHPGYLVRYVPAVSADPSGRPIRVAGAAALQVTIQAPDFAESGHQPWRTPWQLGQRLTGGWSTLREVRFAGSFEHVTSFAVGVRARRPFRVLVLPDPSNHVTRLVVDIAH